ncbi:hypothetical protein O6P43_020382 [Quillaja saponaria]|uniref:Uncharacterized protein n=1 Tax=Quillaja saponaria TaxID=32244 RepID=A0AAD7LKI7_QUISA|nr:hypothetical protein O6P43_020382 [Quillaja saponaria]
MNVICFENNLSQNALSGGWLEFALDNHDRYGDQIHLHLVLGEIWTIGDLDLVRMTDLIGISKVRIVLC